MSKVFIEESTLTDIGDALRRKHGETKMGTIYEDVEVPATVISKTPNATSASTWNGKYNENVIYTDGVGYIFDVVHIPNASTIKINLTYNLAKGTYADALQIAIGNFTNQIEWVQGGGNTTKYVTGVIFNGVEEIFVNSEYVSFRLELKNENADTNLLGYYAECAGYDVDGNPLGYQTIQVEKEVELPNKYNPKYMPKAIDDIKAGEELPEEAFVFDKTCSYYCSWDNWSWFINMYGDKITTDNIGDCDYMFYMSSLIEEMPFDFNFANDNYYKGNYIFFNCIKLKSIGNMINFSPNNINYTFSNCQHLRQLPEFVNPNWYRLQTYQYASMSYLFNSCYSLRSIPESILKELYGIFTSYTYSIFNYGFTNCYALDEIRGLNPQTGTITSNMFGSTFNTCNRVKDIIFATQEDGTPYSVNWKTQTINLTTNGVGFAGSANNILGYNSGITKDKEVKDDASYQALKNDADWYTLNADYSRYNHDSAVNTINSLPDTSAYLASAGGTNTIKFKGAQGGLTDGGAISNLTAEEIAIATAKGWTVTLA